jgi:hypothetical protein
MKRKPTLDEWFLAYQLRQLNKDNFFNPASLDIDITAIVERYRARGERLSYPALVMKALALTAVKVPEINRAYVRTPLGDRVIEFEHISVNMPLALHENGQTHLTAMVVRDAHELRVSEIAEQIRAAQRKSLDETKVTKIAARKPNNLLWRTVLRAIHYSAYHWPGMERLGAGGLSVTSIIEHRDDPPLFHTASLGPTATTVLISGVRARPDGRYILELGIGFNHVSLKGIFFRKMATVLSDILSTTDAVQLQSFD